MKEILVVGLGNPGSRFISTRHNLGQRAVENWCTYIHNTIEPKWRESSNGLYREASLAGVTCLIPLTFMNDSGQAVLSYINSHHTDSHNMLIVHDDLELPLGAIRLVAQGSAKGHNGVRSIQRALGTDTIPRLRLGIGRPSDGSSIDDFVLSPFAPAEKPVVEDMVLQAQSALDQYAAAS